jgi:hypothetical protein
MKKQLVVATFCGVLLFMVGLLWWRVRELEKTVNSLRIQPAANSTVVWQNEQQPKDNSEKKQVFKLIDSPPVDAGKSKVGVPWDVERAMMGGSDQQAVPLREGEWHWDVKAAPPDLGFVPGQPESK